MNQYKELVNNILENGTWKSNRTGVRTLGIFGAMSKYNLRDGFPILTTKKINFHSVKTELIWFLSGSTHVEFLINNGVNIWNDDAYRHWKKQVGKDLENVIPSIQEFVDGIREHKFPSSVGELGYGTYGSMWRMFPDIYDHAHLPCDQIAKVIHTLRTNPDDRRMIVTAWHPGLVDEVALPPCHVMFQFNTEEATQDERYDYMLKRDGGAIMAVIKDHMDKKNVPTRKLNLSMYQRSCDTFLGVPFNITSYSLLLAMVAQCADMIPGTFTHMMGDAHIYENHLDQIKEQIKRDTLALPKLKLNPDIKNIFDFKIEDIQLEHYTSHEAIKGTLNTNDVTPLNRRA